MANQTITQLPSAGPITGPELVPIVQNGQTVKTTAQALAASPTLTQTFLTLNQESTLNNSRYLSGGTGVGLTDGGAQSYLRIVLNGASGSLEAAGNGIVAKTNASTVVARELEVTGAGLDVTNGDGVAGNPTFELTGVAAAVASLGGTGIMAIQNGATVGGVVILGTSNQIAVANGNGTGNPTISLTDNVVLPGTGAVTIPIGTNAQQPVGSNGQLRYNSEEGAFYGFSAGSWRQFSTSGGVTEVNTGTGLTGGPITGVGTISIDDTVVATLSGSQTLTNKTISGSNNTLSNIANSSLTNSSVTYNGVTVALGDSGTITANNPYALTIGTGLQGTSYDGSAAVTIAIDSTVATLSGSQTLTNKTIDANSNTLSNIPNSSLVNYSLTLGTTNVALGGTSLTLGGLTSVTVTQDPTADLQLATKQYVDNVAQGLNVKTACLWGTTANILLTGLTTQVGGEWTGTLNAGDRILVKNQTLPAENGLYAASALGWTRTSDANTWNELVSAFVFVQDGATLGDTGWVCTVNAGGTLGVTAVTWTQFSGAGTYTAGTGLTLTGTQFSITNTGVTAASYGTASKTSTLAINAQGQVTSASEQDIAIAASQVTSGTLAVARGGTNIGSYTAGDLLYASGTTTLSKLGIGTSTYIMTSSGTAPQWSDPTGITVGNATNATNIAITANSTNATNYLTFVDATSGNKAALVNSSITCNPSTGTLTGGIAGGAF